MYVSAVGVRIVFFYICVRIGSAFSLPLGQVPRHDMPGGAIVGWAVVSEQKIGERRRPEVPHQKVVAVIRPAESMTGAKRGGELRVETPGRRISRALGDPPWCPKQTQRSACGRTRGASSMGRGEGSTPGRSATHLDSPPHLDAEPAGLGTGALRGSALAALCDFEAMGQWRGRFLDDVRGARSWGRHGATPDGGHVQVSMRGVGGVHPGFATPNEIEEARREEEKRKVTARDGTLSESKAKRREKGKGMKIISFRQYTQSGIHAQWSLVAPQRNFMRLRMEIQTDLNTLGERRDEWEEKAVKAHGLELTTVELVEYIACYCLLEDLRCTLRELGLIGHLNKCMNVPRI